MKYLKNLYYRLKTSLFFSNPVDRILDFYVKDNLLEGIKHMCINKNNYVTIDFNSGRTLIIKATDKYINWGNSGILIFKGGKFYTWDNRRMSAEMIFKLKKYLSDWEIESQPCV